MEEPTEYVGDPVTFEDDAAHYIYSDMHLSVGKLPNGEFDPMEDFRDAAGFADQLKRILEKHPDRPVVLHPNGDTFDLLATPLGYATILGFRIPRYGEVPTVEAALAKLRVILKAHVETIGAWRAFLEDRSDTRIEFTIGNHDQALGWKELRDEIVKAIAPPGQEHRVTFCYARKIGRDILKYHGDQLHPLNRTPQPGGKDRVFITGKVMSKPLLVAFLLYLFTHGLILPQIFTRQEVLSFDNLGWVALEALTGLMLCGWLWGQFYFRTFGERRSFLNMPVASYMHASLGMYAKWLFFPSLGRMRDHGPIWLLTLARRSIYVLALVPMTVAYVVWSVCFRMYLSVRRSGEWVIVTVLRTLVATTGPDPVHKTFPAFVRRHPGIVHFVDGDTHDAGFRTWPVDGRDVVRRNTGTGVEQHKMALHDVRTVTRLPRPEAFLRRIVYHWTHARRYAVLFLTLHAAAVAATELVVRWQGWEPGIWRWVYVVGAAIMLLLRQSYAEYAVSQETEWTPVEIVPRENGEHAIRLCRYNPKTREFDTYGNIGTS